MQTWRAVAQLHLDKIVFEWLAHFEQAMQTTSTREGWQSLLRVQSKCTLNF